MDSYYREGFVGTAVKLKAEFLDLRSAFMKAFANFQKYEMGEKENAEDDGEDQADDKEYIFSLYL